MNAAASVPALDPLDALPPVAAGIATTIQEIDALLARAEPILLKGVVHTIGRLLLLPCSRRRHSMHI